MHFEKGDVYTCYILTKGDSYVMCCGNYVSMLSMGLTPDCIAMNESSKQTLRSLKKDEYPDYELKTMELHFTLEPVEV